MSTGHCLCGSISYRFDAASETVVLCHCDDCQRHTGSAFSVNVLMARDSVHINGIPRGYQDRRNRERARAGPVVLRRLRYTDLHDHA